MTYPWRWLYHWRPLPCPVRPTPISKASKKCEDELDISVSWWSPGSEDHEKMLRLRIALIISSLCLFLIQITDLLVLVTVHQLVKVYTNKRLSLTQSDRLPRSLVRDAASKRISVSAALVYLTICVLDWKALQVRRLIFQPQSLRVPEISTTYVSYIFFLIEWVWQRAWDARSLQQASGATLRNRYNPGSSGFWCTSISGNASLTL